MPLFVDFWLNDPRPRDAYTYEDVLALQGDDSPFIEELRRRGPDAKELDDFLAGRPGPWGCVHSGLVRAIT